MVDRERVCVGTDWDGSDKSDWGNDELTSDGKAGHEKQINTQTEPFIETGLEIVTQACDSNASSYPNRGLGATPCSICRQTVAAGFAFYLAILLTIVLPLQIQAKPEVEVVVDLLETFDRAQVKEALECVVRRPAAAGGVKQNGLFEHPKTAGRPARVEYQFGLPRIGKDELLLLAFDIALADGVKISEREDGVRFIVEVDGKRLFSEETKESRWQSQTVDLTQMAGQRAQLALLTDAISNADHDWALWGNPRLLHFRDSGGRESRSSEPGKISTSITAGALAISLPTGMDVKFRLKPSGGGAPVEWTSLVRRATGTQGDRMVKDFNFADASAVTLEWEPIEALAAADILVAAYPAQPTVAQLSATRAVISAGETVPLRVEVKNRGRGKLAEGAAYVRLQAAKQFLPAQTLPALAPNETWRGECHWNAPAKPGIYELHAELFQTKPVDQQSTTIEVLAAPKSSQSKSIQNEQVKLEFVRQPEGFAYATVFARQANDWVPVAVWRPLFQVVSNTKKGEKTFEIRPHQIRQPAANGKVHNESIEFSKTVRDADGVNWELLLRVALESNRPVARLHYVWKTARDREVKALRGPNFYVGDVAIGEAKTWGLFPGLEYLYGAERSSNPRDFAPPQDDRRTPHPNKLTVPLMAVTLGPDSHQPQDKPTRFFAPDSLKDQPLLNAPASKSPILNLISNITVALHWNPLQRWDGGRTFPSARFASPNFDEGMRNHRLGLFLPSAPDFVSENDDRAMKPYLLSAGKALTLDASLVVAPGPIHVAMREWLRDRGGLPKPNPWPRSFQEELDACRAGFLKTVWDAQAEKWRHCIGWGASHAPGFAALLWLDSRVAEKPDAQQASRRRVELAVRNMLREGGPSAFISQANCHIMQWEFPFLYGHLPEALASVEGQIHNLIQSQQPDGAWLYQSGNAEQADLGQSGDSVLGTCANRAATLLRYARITGDADALAAGERALHFMERFRVPRGGQTWECPMYEPDILAAAYAIRAYHDAYRVTGNPRWLHDAVYWAETGVPFIYLWALPDRPMMLGATIPVFGSTFYTHTWLGVPVQWCGLVYAYHVFHLAEELARPPHPSTGSPLPLALNFSASDWKRVVELITASGLHQQFADGDRIGAYPDSISRFEQRNGAFLNPEDILVNVLALQGYDPDIKTARLKTMRGEILISSGATIQTVEAAATGVQFQLRFFAGEPSHSLVAGVKPREVLVNGARLARSATPVQRESGWWWDDKQQRVYLTIPHAEQVAQIEIVQE